MGRKAKGDNRKYDLVDDKGAPLKLSCMSILDVPHALLLLRALNNVGPIPTEYVLIKAMRLGKYAATMHNRIQFLRALNRLKKEEYILMHGDCRANRHWEITRYGSRAVESGQEKKGPKQASVAS